MFILSFGIHSEAKDKIDEFKGLLDKGNFPIPFASS